MAELKLPQAWQDWHITEEIGEGAYGRVYRAEKENGGVTAVSAIKVIQVPSERSELLSLRREFRSEEELRRNLKETVDGYANEIRAMYRLQGHTHIVSIQDHLVEEKDDGTGWRIYIRMEYLQPFNDYAVTHTFSRDEIIRLGISLCEALGACAGCGILHRDIKPENLFVTESGQFKLGDFGIAKALDRTVSTYSAKGTFSYMSPEVFRGKPYDSRADLYSTGLILYKMLNRNRDPFVDPDKQIITHQDREEALSLRLKGEKLPAPAEADDELGRIILKACEYDPKDRYATPDEMKQALEALSGNRSAGTEKKPAAGIPKKILIPGIAAVLALAAACVIIFAGRGNKPDVPQETQAAETVLAERVQDFGGVRFTLPEGFVQSSGEEATWVTEDESQAVIEFTVTTEDKIQEIAKAKKSGGSITPEPEFLTIGRYPGEYQAAPQKITRSDESGSDVSYYFIAASFRPEGTTNVYCIYLGKNLNSIQKYGDAFRQMLESAE